jgi:hypothetical protein
VVVQEQEGIDLVQARTGHGAARGQVADVVSVGGMQAKNGAGRGLGHGVHIRAGAVLASVARRGDPKPRAPRKSFVSGGAWIDHALNIAISTRIGLSDARIR